MIVINYRVYKKRAALHRLLGLLAVSFSIGSLMALVTGEALFVFVVLSALIPLMHLVKNKKTKISKFLWGGVSGAFGFVLLILLFMLSEQFTSLLVFWLWGFSWVGTLIFAGFIILSLTFAVAFYWFFISLAEEIYRIKFESGE